MLTPRQSKSRDGKTALLQDAKKPERSTNVTVQRRLQAVIIISLVFMLPAASQAEDFAYAKRLALGLQGGSIGFGPTIEY